MLPIHIPSTLTESEHADLALVVYNFPFSSTVKLGVSQLAETIRAANEERNKAWYADKQLRLRGMELSKQEPA